MKKYPHVFSPIRVGGVVLKNRIISAPSTVHTASSGQPYPTEEGIRFFEDRAKAGAGLVTCAGVSIGGAFDDGVHASWDLKKPNHTNRLVDLSERIHLYGAKCTMELIGVFPEGYTVSDGCSIMGSPPVGREIPKEKMEWFKNEYVEAALGVKAAGFDGVLLHMGHSIPVAQFFSPYTNKRTDEYGGSTENRCRYAVEIMDAVRAAVGPDFIIDVRISGTEYQEGGIDMEEGLKIAEILQDHCDILQASCGMHNSDWMTWTHPCGFLPPNHNMFIADTWKKSGRINKCFVSTIGGLTNLSDCEAVLAAGSADFVVVAREFIADPDWIKKDLAGHPEDVVPCIKCMRCHDSTVYGHQFRCAVNPEAGLDACLSKLVKEPGPAKKVAVIGGGPAGMKAACVAADRGHQVTLFEAKDHLGGAIVFADYVSFKYPLAIYKNWLIQQVEKRPIEVRLNTQATPADVEGFDAVLVAIGAEPLILPVPGVEHAKVATSVYGSEDKLGDTVIVIGGGQVGCETALHLAKLGKKVTVIEMQSALAPDASKTHRDELMVEIGNEPNFVTLCGARCQAVTATSVTYVKDGKEETVTAADVVLAAGMKPRADEADSFIGTAAEFVEIGDCVRARTVEQATKEAYYAAVNL